MGMTTKDVIPCVFFGCRCQRHHLGTGLCKRHRRQQLAGKELQPLRRYERATSDTCAGPDCARPLDAHGYCKTHYGMVRKGQPLHAIGDPSFRSQRARERWAARPEAEKQRALAAMQAGRRTAYYSDEWQQRQSDSQRASGVQKRRDRIAQLRSECATCGASFTPTTWKQLFCTRECRSLAARVRRHGLTPQQYRELLASQDGQCALCGGGRRGWARGADLHIDHCHNTGRVRGLLCGDCNTALGRFGDDPVRLRRAAEYLERHR